MPRTGLLMLLLVLLGIAASYHWNLRQIAAPSVQNSRLQSLPTTYLYKPRSLRYNEQGDLIDILEATSIYSFAHGDESFLEQPRLYAHNASNRSWTGAARSGRYRHEKNLLLLESDVILTHDQNGTQLNTEKMRLDLRKRTARSNVPVTITQGDNYTRSDTMTANLNTERITMRSSVQGLYEPNHQD